MTPDLSPAPALDCAASSLLGGAATPSADCASRGPGAFHSLATASGDLLVSADAPWLTPSREGGECCPATISGMDAALVLAFVDTWISPQPYITPPPRDFTFKAVIGEPSW